MEQQEHMSAIDQAVSQIKELILSGEYKVGDKLPSAKELCEHVGVGRSTVREALGMLKAMGFVSVQHGSGTYVEKVVEETPEAITEWFINKEHELNDFMAVRDSIEIINMKYAILRRTEKEIEQLALIHNRFENAFLRKDFAMMCIIDEEFHVCIAQMSKNNLLIDLNKRIADLLRPYRIRSFSTQDTAFRAIKPHKEILEAIKMQDLERGLLAMQHHINISLEDISHFAEIKP